MLRREANQPGGDAPATPSGGGDNTHDRTSRTRPGPRASPSSPIHSTLGGSPRMSDPVRDLMAQVVEKNPGEPEFHQAVHEVAESVELVLARDPRYRDAHALRADGRARAGGDVPGPVGGRRGRDPGQPRLPRGDEQRDRPVQGRPAVPPVGEPRAAEVPRLRAGLQERPDDAADGRGQGRRRLRPQGPLRRRGDAVLPVLHDRAPAPHRPVHRRPRRRHRGRRSRDRLPVRPVQEDPQRVHGGAHRQGDELGRVARPSGGHRLRRRVLRRGDARDPRRTPGAQGLPRERLGQRRAVHGREAARSATRSRSPCRTRSGSSTTPTGSTARSSRG